VRKVLSKVRDKARNKEIEKRYKEGRHETKTRQKETGKGKEKKGTD
jgi:hypothetical protein